MDYLWMAFIGMIAGWFAGQFMAAKGIGVIGDIVTGMVGALTGGVLFKQSGLLPGSGLTGALIVAITGAVVLLHLLRVVRKIRGRGR